MVEDGGRGYLAGAGNPEITCCRCPMSEYLSVSPSSGSVATMAAPRAVPAPVFSLTLRE